jgi:hypothetical protein
MANGNGLSLEVVHQELERLGSLVRSLSTQIASVRVRVSDLESWDSVSRRAKGKGVDNGNGNGKGKGVDNGNGKGKGVDNGNDKGKGKGKDYGTRKAGRPVR